MILDLQYLLFMLPYVFLLTIFIVRHLNTKANPSNVKTYLAVILL